MFTPYHHLYRLVIAGALACALLTAVMSGPAAAQPEQALHNVSDDRGPVRTSSLAGTTSPQNLHRHDDHGVEAVARAQERYYATAGQTTPLAAPAAATQSPASSDDTPWLLIGLTAAAALVLVATSAVQLRRRRTPRVAL